MLNSFSLDDVRAKSLEMHAKSPGIIYNDPLLSNLAESLKEQIDQRDKQIAKLKRDLDVFEQQIKSLEVQLHDEFGAHRSEMKASAKHIFRELNDVAKKHCESLASVLGHLVCEDDCEARDLLGEIADLVAKERGVKEAAKVILSEEIFKNLMQSMTVPDWVLLYFKISARLPDGAWQMLLNLTRFGNTGVSVFCFKH